MLMNKPYKGLTDAEVAARRREHGANVLTPPAQKPWWKEFGEKFSGPLIIILLIAGVLSVGISFYEYYGLGQDWKVFFEPIGIFVAILLATGLAFLFEQKAGKAFKILNRVNDDEPVEVLRNGTMTIIPRKDVVVGDIVMLNTGDEIPADGELLDAVTLSVDESSLTGEPHCSKTIDPKDFDPEATYPSNHVMRGTKVMEGHGVMRVLRVGDATEMGKVFEEAQIDDSVKTPLNEQLDKLGRWITNVSYIFAGLIIVAQIIHFLGWGAWQAWLLIVPVALFFRLVIEKFEGWSKTACVVTIVLFFCLFIAMVCGAFVLINPGADTAVWSGLLAHTLQTLMVAVTLIVVAVPEGLPMAVTLSLAYSMRAMLKTSNLVRKMHACETMGATTVICTDKTGTLTQNQMQVYKTNFFGNPSDDVLAEGIAVNSTAQLDLSGEKPQVLGNPTEGALLLWLRDRGADYQALRAGATRASVSRAAFFLIVSRAGERRSANLYCIISSIYLYIANYTKVKESYFAKKNLQIEDLRIIFAARFGNKPFSFAFINYLIPSINYYLTFPYGHTKKPSANTLPPVRNEGHAQHPALQVRRRHAPTPHNVPPRRHGRRNRLLASTHRRRPPNRPKVSRHCPHRRTPWPRGRHVPLRQFRHQLHQHPGAPPHKGRRRDCTPLGLHRPLRQDQGCRPGPRRALCLRAGEPHQD